MRFLKDSLHNYTFVHQKCQSLNTSWEYGTPSYMSEILHDRTIVHKCQVYKYRRMYDYVFHVNEDFERQGLIFNKGLQKERNQIKIPSK